MAKPAKILKEGKNSYQATAQHIMHTAGRLQNKMVQALRSYDMSEPQYKVLHILHGQDAPMSLFEVQQRMAQKDSNVSRIIDKLCDKQLVIRKTSKLNKRKVDILITAKGVKLFNTIHPVIEHVLADVFKDVKKEKVKVLSKVLESISEGV